MNMSDDKTAPVQPSQPSSRNGRYWLRASREVNQRAASASSAATGFEVNREDAAHSLPFQTKARSGLPFHESVLVAIPNVAAMSETVRETVAEPSGLTAEDIAQALAEAQPTTEAVEVAAPEQITAEPESFVAQSPVASPTITNPATPTNEAFDDAVEASRSLQNDDERSAIGHIADQIVEQFPLASPATILFVGSEDSMHIDETCARVAAELAARNGDGRQSRSERDHERCPSMEGRSSHQRFIQIGLCARGDLLQPPLEPGRTVANISCRNEIALSDDLCRWWRCPRSGCQVLVANLRWKLPDR